jgi:hypothetical protein
LFRARRRGAGRAAKEGAEPATGDPGRETALADVDGDGRWTISVRSPVESATGTIRDGCSVTLLTARA